LNTHVGVTRFSNCRANGAALDELVRCARVVRARLLLNVSILWNQAQHPELVFGAIAEVVEATCERPEPVSPGCAADSCACIRVSRSCGLPLRLTLVDLFYRVVFDYRRNLR
jgi:hypothetical protein